MDDSIFGVKWFTRKMFAAIFRCLATALVVIPVHQVLDVVVNDLLHLHLPSASILLILMKLLAAEM
jgi:hypothetical protein